MTDAWDQEDEHRRADCEHMLERMRQDYEDSVLAAAEGSLSRIQQTPIPMPNTAHPALEGVAEVVRSARDMHHLRLPKPRSTFFSSAETDDTYPTASLPTMTLTKRKAAGGAPFIGRYPDDQAMYVWWVWTDEAGRHIACDAELVWL